MNHYLGNGQKETIARNTTTETLTMKRSNRIGSVRLSAAIMIASVSQWTLAFMVTTPYTIPTISSDRSSRVVMNSLVLEPSEDSISCWDEGLISPHHLLYPEMFRTSKTPLDQSLPLFSSLQLMRKAIKSSIIQQQNDNNHNAKFRRGEGEGNHKVLRIEHKISHTVDPLCWLQAQRKLNQHKEYPAIYFSTAEGTLEAAAFGSAIVFTGTADDDAYWDIVRELPPSTFLYGGQRFDTESKISEEWQSFNKGFWVLPAVEVRIERQGHGSPATTTLAVHLVADAEGSLLSSARHVLDVLSLLTDACTPMTPPTTLPPVLSRMSTYGQNLDGQEIYEKGVTAALERFANSAELQKVVLARRMDLSFSRHASDNMDALDVLRKWKFASQPGGHLFFISPGGSEDSEFFGCTPERLFRIVESQVMSEALAGTRPRGSTPEDDAALSRQLFESTKDQAENQIIGSFIRDTFHLLETEGYLKTSVGKNGTTTISGDFFIRRLRHLQHICQRYQCSINKRSPADTTRRLLSELHPTPAVGGFPKKTAMEFIRIYESSGFDRGFYSGPVGAIGRDSAEIAVAIRSGLLTKSGERPKLSVFAGAGIVPGSSVQGEWAETAYKLAVVTSVFPQAPITLQSATTPNAAWATAFVEELIRNGITQFYISPGSRSTPLVAAIAKAIRSNVGVVRALSIHDERGAAFRAVGYGRGNGRPAAVVTSSGTAVANLYPAIVEASMDGVPMVLLTADRPYESRNTGANQAIDQTKIFSDTYLRWFRDIVPPSDTVPVSLALADAAHAVTLARNLRGPVHLNIQFRENLAPIAGPIRNDERQGAVTKYDAMKFTETPGFQRWSFGGSRWLHSYAFEMSRRYSAVTDVGNLIAKSKRGIIVVGNLRKDVSGSSTDDISDTVALISSFAQTIGFPVFASALSATLRFDSACVVPFAEHILKSPQIRDNLNPDLVLQLGAPLISTEIHTLIKSTMRDTPIHHVLIHPSHSHERADPEFTVSHNIDADIGTFVRALGTFLGELPGKRVKSELAPIIGLGRILQKVMPDLVKDAAIDILRQGGDCKRFSEPELTMAISRALSDATMPELSLFISNSMPIRDAEAFLYPLGEDYSYICGHGRLKDTGVNRGASGIDGIISSASGFAESTNRPTTLMIGDVAALHDINSLHALQTSSITRDAESQKNHPLTTIVLNNDGGGIFSFLPIAGLGAEVGFEEYFGTPTRSFSFERAADAFGLAYAKVEDASTFGQAYLSAIKSGNASLIEAIVATRDENVMVHKEITKRTNELIESILDRSKLNAQSSKSFLPMREYHADSDSYLSLAGYKSKKMKTMVLLHGWMGDKSEWDGIGKRLAENLKGEWRVISLDLPGHGDSELVHSTPGQLLRSCLHLEDDLDSNESPDLGLDAMALAVEKTVKDAGVHSIEAIAGYSLGGRVALAMHRSYLVSQETLITDTSKLILLSTYPGDLIPTKKGQHNPSDRLKNDDQLASTISSLFDRTMLLERQVESVLVFSDFLNSWYGASLWGSIKKRSRFPSMVYRRARSLARRGRDHGAVLQDCSPPRCRSDDWRAAPPERTLYISGLLDEKYTAIGSEWIGLVPELKVEGVLDAGHSLLFEAPGVVTSLITDFVRSVSLPKMALDDEVVEAAWSITDNESSTQEPKNESSKALQGIDTRSFNGCITTVASLDFEMFTIDFAEDGSQKSGVAGLGWGEKAKAQTVATRREGYIIQIMSLDGLHIGIGEVAPLPGLHSESLADVAKQLNDIAQKISKIRSDTAFSFDARRVLSLDGGLTQCINELLVVLEVEFLLSSVSSGVEMALMSLASQAVRAPIHQALMEAAAAETQNPLSVSSVSGVMPLNGLITRGSAPAQIAKNQIFGNTARMFQYESWKVKVGHQSAYEDAMAVSYAYHVANSYSLTEGKVRADANRAFNTTMARHFASVLREIDGDAFQRLEYVEEPLQRCENSTIPWSFAAQFEALERWSASTEIRFALDESLSDLAEEHAYNFDAIRSELIQIVPSGETGCAALVLKPSLLGLELSMRLARLARTELGLGAVFTSSFDSGVGLAFASFLASISDATPATHGVPLYAHGFGTFELLADDCLKPSFGSYVNQQGKLNIASLSRAFYGLGLDELKCLSIDPLPTPELTSSVSSAGRLSTAELPPGKDFETPEEFEASTSTSSNGREIQVVASLPLPFSAEVACSRFTDLPQQPRWSPWINSVSYVDATSETEWRLRIRGVNFRWRAKSGLLSEPYLGIRWQSVSGLQNTGAVEFIPTHENTCLMKVQITFVSPRILSPLFKGTTIFFEDFLRNKVLKWSLEMFRDVVKGDLALEEGNIELGDALFGSVEGKANAIEATFSSSIDKD